MLPQKQKIVEELGEMIAAEHLIEKLLERASRAPEDPRAVAYLWNQATECRDHARILLRHRQMVDRHAPGIPYPRWRRGRGPGPREALEQARDLASGMSSEYERGLRSETDPYLRKFLQILAEEHKARSFELQGIAAGRGIFEDVDTIDDAD